VPLSEVHWFFIEDYFDGPISGLARWRGQTVAFTCFADDFPDEHMYVFTLHALNDAELKEELRIKEKFEKMVSTHWSFDKTGQPLPRISQDAESQKRFYIEEPQRRRTRLHPFDCPVLAWFDVRDGSRKTRQSPRAP
jgi:hypothetical protein